MSGFTTPLHVSNNRIKQELWRVFAASFALNLLELYNLLQMLTYHVCQKRMTSHKRLLEIRNVICLVLEINYSTFLLLIEGEK